MKIAKVLRCWSQSWEARQKLQLVSEGMTGILRLEIPRWGRASFSVCRWSIIPCRYARLHCRKLNRTAQRDGRVMFKGILASSCLVLVSALHVSWTDSVMVVESYCCNCSRQLPRGVPGLLSRSSAIFTSCSWLSHAVKESVWVSSTAKRAGAPGTGVSRLYSNKISPRGEQISDVWGEMNLAGTKVLELHTLVHTNRSSE